MALFTGHQLAELRAQSRLIYASALGLTAGMTATMFYSLGAFIPELQAEFGWSRSDLSLAATFLTLAVFITGTTAGKLCDRFGAAIVGTVSLVAYALAVLALTFWVSRIAEFWFAYALIAVLGVGSTPIVLVRPITTGFIQARGIALGVALTGAGIAGFWVPRLVAWVSTEWGWRQAYWALAAIALAVAPVVWFGFRDRINTVVQAVPSGDGLTPAEARSTQAFWLLSAMALTMACGVAGVVVHMVPLFTDQGLNAVTAAGIASLLGISSVVGRLMVGYFLDRLPSVLVSIAVLLLAACGVLLLWAYGLQYAYVASLLLGLAAGAEIDLIAYLTVSFFGRQHYGAIYGWQYSVFALGYGLSPYLLGRVYDYFGSYQWALLASAALIVAAIGCCCGLPGARRQLQRSVYVSDT